MSVVVMAVRSVGPAACVRVKLLRSKIRTYFVVFGDFIFLRELQFLCEF